MRLDYKEGAVQYRRHGLPEAEPNIRGGFFGVGNAKEIAAAGASHECCTKDRVVPQTRQIEILTGLLPDVQSADVLDVWFPEPRLEHIGEVDWRPVSDQEFVLFEHPD